MSQDTEVTVFLTEGHLETLQKHNVVSLHEDQIVGDIVGQRRVITKAREENRVFDWLCVRDAFQTASDQRENWIFIPDTTGVVLNPDLPGVQHLEEFIRAYADSRRRKNT